jgi:hypothetical protein
MLPPKHTAGLELSMATLGIGFTVIVRDAVAEQLKLFVPVTVYVVELAGVTVIAAVVCPPFQAYELPPLAVSVTLDPAQIELLALVIVMAGTGSKLITKLSVAEQPAAFVPVA